MGKFITIHSYKGGTGKTFFAVNMAAMCVNTGKSVCLLDYDLRAPSLQDTFGPRGSGHWTTNDFLDGRCGIKNALADFTDQFAKKGGGKLLIGLANPSTEAIREVLVKDRRWEMKALKRMVSSKSVLFDDLGMDYVLLDTSPGISYSSLNAIAVSDYVVGVATMDTSDLLGIRRMVEDLYEALEKQVGILINKVPAELLLSEGGEASVNERVDAILGSRPLSLVPCFCDVLQSSRETIFALENPEHRYTKIVAEIVEKL